MRGCPFINDRIDDIVGASAPCKVRVDMCPLEVVALGGELRQTRKHLLVEIISLSVADDIMIV